MFFFTTVQNYFLTSSRNLFQNKIISFIYIYNNLCFSVIIFLYWTKKGMHLYLCYNNFVATLLKTKYGFGQGKGFKFTPCFQILKLYFVLRGTKSYILSVLKLDLQISLDRLEVQWVSRRKFYYILALNLDDVYCVHIIVYLR